MKVEIPKVKTNYIHIKQSEKQFKALYGDKTTWSKVTKAAYLVIIDGKDRVKAQDEFNVTPQAMYSFLTRNKKKHNQMFELAKMQKEYEAIA